MLINFVDVIILVGGLLEFILVFKFIKDLFELLVKVLNLLECGLFVLKGVVLFGFIL